MAPPKFFMPDVVVPKLDAPKVEVNVEAIEDAAISAFKVGKKAVHAVSTFNEEHDLINKAKTTATKIAEFNEKHDVLTHVRAMFELGFDAATKVVQSGAKKPVSRPAVQKKLATKKAPATKALPKKSPAKKPSTKKITPTVAMRKAQMKKKK